jgi:hypothetical protein
MDATKKENDIFIGIPCYGNKICEGAVKGVLAASNQRLNKTIQFSGFSILTRNFNALWTQALNSREQGTTHFCMLHEDISPEPYWLDKMLRIMGETDADILSVVSPMKDNRGLTSTALDEPLGDADQRYRVRRLTLTEIHAKPATWTDEKLLVNSGLMLVKLDDRCEKLWFEFNDAIVKNKDGKWGAVGMSEDWNFSRKAHQLGMKIFVTREISLQHLGMARYSNGLWGSVKEDDLNV